MLWRLALPAAAALLPRPAPRAPACLRAAAVMRGQHEWRLFGVELPAVGTEEEEEGRFSYNDAPLVPPALHEEVARRLKLEPEALPPERLRLVRKSLDARPPRRRGGGGRGGRSGEREVRWSFVVDVTLTQEQSRRLKKQPGRLVPAAGERAAR